MNDMRKEGEMQCGLTGRLMRSRIRWAGHLVRMGAGKPVKRAEVEKHQEKGKATAEMGGLREEGNEKIGRMTDGERGKPMEKKRAERVARQYFT